MSNIDTDQKEIIKYINIARGQLDGIAKMIEDERYCIDISKQILSVQALLKKANLVNLKRHMNHCVKSAIEKGEGEDKIDEVMNIIDKYVDR